MLSQGVWSEELNQWVRSDKNECCVCENRYSTSPELFLVKLTEGKDRIYCNVCLGEGPLSEGINKIESITKVGLTFIKVLPQDLESLNAIKKTLEKISLSKQGSNAWKDSDYSEIICFATNLVHSRFEEKHGLNMYKVLKDTKNAQMESNTPEHLEIDLWTDKLERFRTEFSSMNDVKFDGSDVIEQQGVDKRYSLLYRNFGGELKFPEQGYYQLKNVFRNLEGK